MQHEDPIGAQRLAAICKGAIENTNQVSVS